MTSRKRTKVPTPVIDAVLARDASRLREALAAGGDVDERDRDGRTALHQACVDAREDLVDVLLERGAQAALADREGRTPLHFATRSYAVGIARKLLKAGAPVDAGDAHGNTPLSDAVFESKGRGDMIRLLLEAGADPNRQNAHGVSPAALAASIANYDVKQWMP